MFWKVWIKKQTTQMCTHTSKPKQEFMLVLYANNISDYVNGIILISTKSFPIWVRRSLIINKIIHCLVAARAKLVLSWQIFCCKNWPNAYLYMKYFFPLERQTFLPGGVETAQTVGPKQAMKLAERGLFFHLSDIDSCGCLLVHQPAAQEDIALC